MEQHLCTWRNLTGHRHSKLFISGPCRKRADNLLRLSRRQLKMVVAILTEHAPVRKHLHTMGLFDGDPTADSAGRRPKQYSTLSAAARLWVRQRYNVFGSLEVEPTDIRTASVRDLCLLIRGTGLQKLT
jgi:hypothetical protein